MSRDRAKLIFDLERKIVKLECELLMRGNHTFECEVSASLRSQYWTEPDMCNCGWLGRKQQLVDIYMKGE